ncbi:MFS transporter [Halobacteriales archaeon Cl-PHB]
MSGSVGRRPEPPHTGLTLATAVSNFSTGVALAVLPAFGAVRSGPALYGWMLAALGVGRLIGSAVASRLQSVKYGHLKVVGYGLGCLCWLGAVLSPWPAVTVGLFCLAWIPAGVSSVMGSTLYQRVIPDHVLGRVSSVSAAAAMFTLPVGAFVGGIVATHLGIVGTMALTASGFGFVSLFHAARPGLRNLPAMDAIDEDAYDLNVPPATGSGDAE